MDEIAQKRTYIYAAPPKTYGMGGCKCGNQETAWSENIGQLWCEQCQRDFIPEDIGYLCLGVTEMQAHGCTLDRIDLETNEYHWFNPVTGDYEVDIERSEIVKKEMKRRNNQAQGNVLNA